MEFNRKLKWIIFLVIPLFLFYGCGDLEPEMQDTRSVVLKINLNQRSSSRSSQISQNEVKSHKTHLILALPAWEHLSSSYRNFYSSFAQGLMTPPNNKVSLDIPLNTQMKIFAFLFSEEYTLPQLFSGVREVGYYGESQPFSIGTNTNNLSLGITLQSTGTTTGDSNGGGNDGGDTNGDGDLENEGGYDGDNGSQGGNDNTAPTVTFSPANGTAGIGVSGNITITFSEAVRNTDDTVLTDSDIDRDIITLKYNYASGSDNITFDASINNDKTVITINPTSDLFYSQTVYVAIDATLEDYAGNPITANAAFTTVIDPSLEAYYPFNGNANDESGNSFHGQLGDNNTTSKFPSLTPDRYGNANKAFYFDGGDYIALNKHITHNSISEITVCAWVLSTDNTSKKFIISFDRSESYRLSLKSTSNTYVGWDTTDSSGELNDLRMSSVSYEDGNWHHICGWYNSSTTTDKKIFVDGDIVASDNNSHSGKNLGTNETRYGYIGWGSEASIFHGNNYSYHHQADFMIGKIDDVRIYSRALSDSEISALYLREKPLN